MGTYECVMCEEERVETERYGDNCKSIAEFCDTCGHLSDFALVD